MIQQGRGGAMIFISNHTIYRLFHISVILYFYYVFFQLNFVLIVCQINIIFTMWWMFYIRMICFCWYVFVYWTFHYLSETLPGVTQDTGHTDTESASQWAGTETQTGGGREGLYWSWISILSAWKYLYESIIMNDTYLR